MTTISSPQNPRIKQIRALRSRKERERTGLFFVEGVQLVAAALEHRAPIELLVVAPELLSSAVGREVARRLGSAAPRLEVTARVFASFSDREDVQGLGAVVRQRWTLLERVARGDRRCRVALDGVQYPGNLGTILRTSDAAGGAGAILIGPTADPHDPAAVRASTGAVFTQELSRASPAQLAAWAGARGATVVGASPGASVDYRLARYEAPVVLAMGSEGHGLSPTVRGLCRTLVHIPMVGSGDSLNLAIATGLVLYEVFRQQRPCG
jgi:RNA methyltransferase, TrmH family